MITIILVVGLAGLVVGITIGRWSARARPSDPRVWEQIEMEVRGVYLSRNSAIVRDSRA